MIFARRFYLLTRARAEPIVRACFRGALSVQGFAEVAPLVWRRDVALQVWQVLDFYRTKGAGLRARWGFSFPFVPRIRGKRLERHESPEMAKIDLWLFDPVLEREHPPVLDLGYGVAELGKQAKRLAPVVASALSASAAEVDGLRSLPRIFEEQKAAWSQGMGFYTFTQHALAYGLVLARLGRREAGLRELQHILGADGCHEAVRRELLNDFDGLLSEAESR
jgi:hypothetical protein